MSVCMSVYMYECMYVCMIVYVCICVYIGVVVCLFICFLWSLFVIDYSNYFFKNVLDKFLV